MTTIHLIRHAEVHNPDRILYLRLPGVYLSADGHLQAQHLGQVLKSRRVAVVYSSPMPRAIQTADYIAYEHGLVTECSALLNELYSPYQGYSVEAMERAGWELFNGIAAEYEQLTDVGARVQRFCIQCCEAHPGREVVAVTHGDVALTAILWARGLPLDMASRRSVPYPDIASITTLESDSAHSRPRIREDSPSAG
ncbi:MAG TPA: histidine phosphatase family protein [Aggregatilineaceae bacterium]|jgi:probable phosphoglycerate mutase|nr:histidine phosphatase family protein [Aggregatilineaceae bacterium]